MPPPADLHPVAQTAAALQKSPEQQAGLPEQLPPAGWQDWKLATTVMGPVMLNVQLGTLTPEQGPAASHSRNE